ncbi:hypothetical protein M404DRAFT_1001770 [Pisolithus tinctorius Marx 270]|uniref:Uncharacterized protein n=1 Tax=Pisolithus tinctorius Marx 270 TaxID=870435 RepID=A0A0C3K0I9_PISTI|nr:hypothetical protein M404DRAFT_1001770 [Pisolithus tinctorius Marx 270]
MIQHQETGVSTAYVHWFLQAYAPEQVGAYRMIHLFRIVSGTLPSLIHNLQHIV